MKRTNAYVSLWREAITERAQVTKNRQGKTIKGKRRV